MSFNAAALKLMADKGLSAHDIAEIAAAAEQSCDSTAERRRAWDRERKREKREAGRLSGGMSGGNPPDKGSNDKDILTSKGSKKSEPKGSSKKFILPADIPAEPWLGFEEMRQRIRKPLTAHASSLAVSELRRLRDEEGWPPGDVLNHCTMNSYQGIYPPKRAQNERTAPTVNAVNRILGDLRNGGSARQDSHAGRTNVDDGGTARALAPRRD